MQTQTIVKINKKDYQVGYPTVGEKLEIENLKLVLSLGNYGELSRNSHKTAIDLLDLIDAVSYFKILCPTILDILDIKDFTKITFEQNLKLRKAFKVYASWISEFESEMYKSLEDVSDIENKEEAAQ